MVDAEIVSADCSIIPLPDRPTPTFLISTTDFFYPLIDDPYLQGRIGCANVLSDIYSLGIPDCDNMLMLLAASEEVPGKYRKIVTSLMMKGFSDMAKEAGTIVTGGQSVRNPWPIIGGVAMCVRDEQRFIRPVSAQPGDLVVLTKPIGTQVAVNSHQWLHTNPDMWAAISSCITPEAVEAAYHLAIKSMSRLNRTGAKLMQKYGAHAATDVTGFGLLGHATNLASEQCSPCTLEIHTLPILRGMQPVAQETGFPLLEGRSAETSGGLLVCLPADKAQAFCDEIMQIDKEPAWIIGKVVPLYASGEKAKILPDRTILAID